MTPRAPNGDVPLHHWWNEEQTLQFVRSPGSPMTRNAALGLLVLLVPVSAFAPIRPAPETATAEGVSVHFGPENTASFHLSDGAVVKIDLRARGMAYSISLECAGGALRDVRYDTITLVFSDASDGDDVPSRGATLLFDMGREDERHLGSLPRVQISFSNGRRSELLVARRATDSATTWERICDNLPTRPLCEPGVPPPRALELAATLVERLRPLPTPLPATVVHGERAEAERIRTDTYERLLARGAEAVAALAAALDDPDLNMRRNVALAFGALAGGWWSFECGHKRLEIAAALPALVAATNDTDSNVRAWSAQAIGYVGADAAAAVPALISLLDHPDEGARNSAALALRGIGPAANAALPALRAALSDPSPDVRRFASNAIERIEGRERE